MMSSATPELGWWGLLLVLYSIGTFVNINDPHLTQAELQGIPINLVEIQPRGNIGREEHLSRFPLSQGKIPGFKGPKVSLTETIAISLVSCDQAGEYDSSANLAKCDSTLQDFQTPHNC